MHSVSHCGAVPCRHNSILYPSPCCSKEAVYANGSRGPATKADTKRKQSAESRKSSAALPPPAAPLASQKSCASSSSRNSVVTLLVIVVMYLLCNVPRLTLNTAEYILRDKVHSVDECDCFEVSLPTMPTYNTRPGRLVGSL